MNIKVFILMAHLLAPGGQTMDVYRPGSFVDQAACEAFKPKAVEELKAQLPEQFKFSLECVVSEEPTI